MKLIFDKFKIGHFGAEGKLDVPDSVDFPNQSTTLQPERLIADELKFQLSLFFSMFLVSFLVSFIVLSHSPPLSL